jgi:hypothetical protein
MRDASDRDDCRTSVRGGSTRSFASASRAAKRDRAGKMIAMAHPDDPPPQRPTEPDPADCCGEGCVNCVFDVYDTRLARYQTQRAAWCARHPLQDPDHPDAQA